ncbi:MAG: triacylglycerol lipase, partial [Myxococcota bacterium]
MTHRIYLVPGFFGFANVGELKYFAHVRTLLEDSLSAHQVEAIVHYVPTLPTASIRRRTERLLEIIAGTATPNRDKLHLIGHSTGGLDARLLAAPGVTLPGPGKPEMFAPQIETVVCVSTPHMGTPLAAFFNGMFGQKLLRLLSAFTLHSIRLGSTPITALAALAEALPGSGLFIEGNILDQIYRDLLRDFDATRREDLVDFFGQVSAEQSLVTQLTPDAMDLFNATAADRPGVRYGCVLTLAPRPRMLNQLRMGVRPIDHAMYALYRTLHQLTAKA